MMTEPITIVFLFIINKLLINIGYNLLQHWHHTLIYNRIADKNHMVLGIDKETVKSGILRNKSITSKKHTIYIYTNRIRQFQIRQVLRQCYSAEMCISEHKYKLKTFLLLGKLKELIVFKKMR